MPNGVAKIMLIHKPSKIQKIFGSAAALSLGIGIIGTILLIVTGVKSTPIYWNMVWTMMAFLGIGLIGTRMYSLIWRRK